MQRGPQVKCLRSTDERLCPGAHNLGVRKSIYSNFYCPQLRATATVVVSVRCLAVYYCAQAVRVILITGICIFSSTVAAAALKLWSSCCGDDDGAHTLTVIFMVIIKGRGRQAGSTVASQSPREILITRSSYCLFRAC